MSRAVALAWNAYARAVNAGAAVDVCQVLRGRYVFLATGRAGGRYPVVAS